MAKDGDGQLVHDGGHVLDVVLHVHLVKVDRIRTEIVKFSSHILFLRTRMTPSPIKHLFAFGVGKGVLDGEVGQVGDLGQCQGHVVLHTSGQSRPNPDGNSLIFKSYSISNYDDAIESKQTLYLGLGTSYVSKDLMANLFMTVDMS